MHRFAPEIRHFVVNNFLMGKGERLTDDSSFLEWGLIDSTGMLELVSYLEQSYKIEVLDDELIPDNLDSINRIGEYLERKLARNNAQYRPPREEACSVE